MRATTIELMPDIPATIAEAAAALRSGALTSTELTTACLAAADRIDPMIGCFLARFDERALEAAGAADAALRSGADVGPLHGIPIGIKDVIATKDGPTTANSLVLDPAWGARGDAPVVARLRAAGAVIVGKLTTMEYACGMPDPDKPFPIPRNPWNLDCWAGGSSSGTANGVAAGLILGGLGTDTAGSVRCPASFCGISGIRGTFGRVPVSGCVPVGFSLDTIGPMARSAFDCALMLEVIAGRHHSDQYSSDVPVPRYTAGLDSDLTGMRLAVDRVHTADRAPNPSVPAALDEALRNLVAAGAVIEEIALPLYDELTVAMMATVYAEAFTYHRKDLIARWHEYGKPTRIFAAHGALVTAADFVQAQRVRAAGVVAMMEALAGFDAVLTPTALTSAPAVQGTNLDDVLGSLCTQVWPAVGFPALSVPMGFDTKGLPLGLQVVAPPYHEHSVFRVGAALQARTNWHVRIPPVSAPIVSSAGRRSGGPEGTATQGAGCRGQMLKP